MSARAFIPLGCDQQGRLRPTALLNYEDAVGTCNTCPGELEPAEAMQADLTPTPPPYPWRDLGLGLAVMFVAICGASVLAMAPSALMVAAR